MIAVLLTVLAPGETTPIDVPPGWTAEVIATADYPFAGFLGDHLTYVRDERIEELDLNGDGDARDWVGFVRDVATGETKPLGVAHPSFSQYVRFSSDPEEDRWFLVLGDEHAEGKTDLNGDGDADDEVSFLYDTVTGALELVPPPTFGDYHAFNRYGLVWDSSELLDWAADQGDPLLFDYNGDGDLLDSVVFVHDRLLGTTTPVVAGLASEARLRGRRVVIAANEIQEGSTDINLDGDKQDRVRTLVEFGQPGSTVIPVAAQVFSKVQYMPTELDTPYWMLIHEKMQGNTDLDGNGVIENTVLVAYSPATDTVTNLGIAARYVERIGNLVLLSAYESGLADLNGDGDDEDAVAFLGDLATGTVVNTGIASFVNLNLTSTYGQDDFEVGNGFVTFRADEDDQGVDLNGDGSLNSALVVYDLGAGQATFLHRASEIHVLGDVVFYSVTENSLTGDLNGNGTLERALFAYDVPADELTVQFFLGSDPEVSVDFAVDYVDEAELGLDLDGDGELDDVVLHLADFANGLQWTLDAYGANPSVFSTSAIGPSAGDSAFAILVDEGLQNLDLDGDGDRLDHVLMLVRRDS